MEFLSQVLAALRSFGLLKYSTCPGEGERNPKRRLSEDRARASGRLFGRDAEALRELSDEALVLSESTRRTEPTAHEKKGHDRRDDTTGSLRGNLLRSTAGAIGPLGRFGADPTQRVSTSARVRG